MHRLLLYGTEGCHLCEEAECVLLAAGVDWRSIDIVDDAVLMDAYGLRIPVLKRSDNGEEIDWPFSRADVLLLAG